MCRKCMWSMHIKILFVLCCLLNIDVLLWINKEEKLFSIGTSIHYGGVTKYFTWLIEKKCPEAWRTCENKTLR